MLDKIFRGVFDSQTMEVISVGSFLLCVVVALVTGLIMAVIYTRHNYYTKSFLVTIALLPAIVCVVIMMVNGNLGAGVAVAGAFSLVRFRSVPGTAREISEIFLTMCAGLLTGMGYLGFALLFTLILSGIMLLYDHFDFGEGKNRKKYKILHITIPEDLNYAGMFDEILDKYTVSHELKQVKTTNMGSLYKLTFHIVLNSGDTEKELLDKLRCRNGNLEISLSDREMIPCEL